MLKSQYLKIESDEPSMIHHINDLNELEFVDTTDYTQTEDTSNNSKQNSFTTGASQNKRHKSVFYQIKIEKKFMKCPRFYFYCGDKLLFSAKQKINQVFIAEGKDIHINDKKTKNIAIITQNSDGYNFLNVNDQVIKIYYLRTSPSQFKKLFSLRLSFMNYDELVHWSPKILRRPEQLCGQYNRKPIKSKKNILLQNKARHITFIVRKMDKQLYEAECNNTLAPIIAFSIAISEIIGPFMV